MDNAAIALGLVLLAGVTPASLLAQNLSEKMQQIFDAPTPRLLGPVILQQEKPQTVFDQIFTMEEIKNTHYQTAVFKPLGKNQTFYSFSCQEEARPNNLALHGPLSLLIIEKGSKTPIFFRLRDIEKTEKPVTLGGSEYLVMYEPWGLRPDLGKIKLKTKEANVPSETLTNAEILKATYRTSVPLKRNGQQIPIRIALFTKLSSLESRANKPGTKESCWIMLLKDGMDAPEYTNSPFAKFPRSHIDADQIPITDARTHDKTKDVEFEGHILQFNFIAEEEKEIRLRVRAYKK